MTDLREKVRGIVACAKDDMVSLDDATDAIMALVQPVVTDEMVRAASVAFERSNGWGGNPQRDHYDTCEEWAEAYWGGEITDALTAALPHAVTRDDVIEKLAVEADEFDLELGVEAELHGVDQKTPLLGIADWIRSRKGGA